MAGDRQTRVDPAVSEWGNPAGWRPVTYSYGQTQGTETSKYLKEKKEKSISLVVASEQETAQTVIVTAMSGL